MNNISNVVNNQDTNLASSQNNSGNSIQDLPKTVALESLTKNRPMQSNKRPPTKFTHLKNDNSPASTETSAPKRKSVTLETPKPDTTNTDSKTSQSQPKTATKEKVTKVVTALALFVGIVTSITMTIAHFSPQIEAAKEKLTPLFNKTMENLGKTMHEVKVKVEELFTKALLRSPVFVLVR